MDMDATVPNVTRRYVAIGRPMLACRWTVDDQGRTAAQWLDESRALDAEQWVRLPVDPAANDSPEQARPAGHWEATTVKWLAISALLVLAVLGLVLGVSTEPYGL